MKSTFYAAVVALATLAAAQSGIQDLPDCAKTCVTQFTTGTDIGDCKTSDAKCICSSASFLSDIACCLVGKCDTADQQKATDFAHQFCALSGVTNLPAAVSCTSTTAGATSPTPATSAPQNSSTPSTPPASTSSAPASATSASTTPSATPNSASQNVVKVGAGILCAGIAAMI